MLASGTQLVDRSPTAPSPTAQLIAAGRFRSGSVSATALGVRDWAAWSGSIPQPFVDGSEGNHRNFSSASGMPLKLVVGEKGSRRRLQSKGLEIAGEMFSREWSQVDGRQMIVSCLLA